MFTFTHHMFQRIFNFLSPQFAALPPLSEAASSQYFISPPNLDKSDPYTATIGETIHAVWQTPYSYINFNVLGPLENGWYQYLALFMNQPSNGSYAFELGQSLLDLSPGGDQSNNTKYWLKIEEIDASSGDTTGNWFSTEEFFIYLPAAGAATSTMASPTTSTISSSTVNSIETVTVTGTWASTWSPSMVSTMITTSQATTPAVGTDPGQSTTAAAAASQTASSSSGYTVDQKIALGVTIGLGLPALLVTTLTLWVMCIQGDRKT
ncbi:hypothetical protein MMC34_001346 [Xylographa carneopallida]|nr:hypothetical protein [Xylographa carneopallida]